MYCVTDSSKFLAAFVTFMKRGMECQSDPDGFGVVASKPLKRGDRFVDSAVRWHEGELPHRLRGTDFYIKLKAGDGYFELKRDSGFTPFQSPTYFLNEARASNKPEAQTANVKYMQGHSPTGQSLARRFEWQVLKDIPEGGELVVQYAPAL